MASTSATLEQALQHHSEGRLALAEQMCCQVLEADPQQSPAQRAHALGLLSVLESQSGRNDVAAEYLRRAVALQPQVPEFHHTAIAHLAGALGVPCWVALPGAPDWRWLLDREDSPWYPTLRLFRQRKDGDWGEVFERMADALRESAVLEVACPPTR